MSNWKSSPCLDCGVSPKELGRGKRFCYDCGNGRMNPTDLAVEARKAKAAAERAANDEKRAWKNSDKQQRKAARAFQLRMIAEAPEGKLWCAQCERHLLVNRFAARASRPNGRAPWCRACTGNYNHGRMISRYGITADDYSLMLEFQNGACWICGDHPKARKLAVDHCHTTGEVRGLLCKRCNRDLLGRARDDPAILRRAAEYLENPPARKVLA